MIREIDNLYYELNEFNDSELREIANHDYGLDSFDLDRASIVDQCVAIEYDNYYK